MINFDDYVNENKIEYNKNWPYIPDHPCRILIVGGSGSGKTNVLLNSIENQPDIDKIYLYAKDPYNPDKENKILIVFDDMIAVDIIHNKTVDSMVTELFIRDRKLNISLVFKVPKEVRLNTTHFLSQKSQMKENLNKLQ